MAVLCPSYRRRSILPSVIRISTLPSTKAFHYFAWPFTPMNTMVAFSIPPFLHIYLLPDDLTAQFTPQFLQLTETPAIKMASSSSGGISGADSAAAFSKQQKLRVAVGSPVRATALQLTSLSLNWLGALGLFLRGAVGLRLGLFLLMRLYGLD